MKGIFEGEVQGLVTIDIHGQIIIPAKVQETLRIKPEDKLIVIVNIKRKIIGLMPTVNFHCLLDKSAKTISRLGKDFPEKKL